MVDSAKAIEMLHPMREPPLPDSFVPALVMLLGGCATAAVLIGLAWHARRRTRDLRAPAFAALAATRTLGSAERLAGQAALLRRLALAFGSAGAARLQGPAWLDSLDRCFTTDFFSRGAGAAFGDALYAPQPAADVEALDRSLAGLFAGMRRVARRRTAQP